MKRFPITEQEFVELMPLYKLLDSDANRPAMLFDYLINKIAVADLIAKFKTTKPPLYAASEKLYALKLAFEDALVRRSLTELDVQAYKDWSCVRVFASKSDIKKLKQQLIEDEKAGKIVFLDRV